MNGTPSELASPQPQNPPFFEFHCCQQPPELLTIPPEILIPESEEKLKAAMRIINKGNTVVAVKNDDFIVVGISKNDVSKLRIYDSIGYRTILLDDRVTVTYSGASHQAETLLNILNSVIEDRLEQATQRLSVQCVINLLIQFQKDAQLKYNALLAVGWIVAGFDEFRKNSPSRVFYINPLGVVSSWGATAIGSESVIAKEQLEMDYDDNITADKAIELTINSIAVASKSTKMDIVVMHRSGICEKIDLKSKKFDSAVHKAQEILNKEASQVKISSEV